MSNITDEDLKRQIKQVQTLLSDERPMMAMIYRLEAENDDLKCEVADLKAKLDKLRAVLADRKPT